MPAAEAVLPSSLLLGVLAYGVYPLWLAAGLADFLCHRATGIEHTAGLAESRLHRIQMALAGTPVVLWLECEVTAGALLAMAACVLLHTAVAYVDTRWTAPRRRIGPFEQHLHSVLDAAPPIGLAVVALLHRDQLRAPDVALRWRDPPLPLSVWIGVLGSAALFAVLPALLEWRRCAQAAR